jgi:hypothetical protein
MMPLYFLHIGGSQVFLDEKGYEFVDMQAARAMAVLCARELIVNDLKRGRPLGLGRFFRITTEDGKTVAEVPFSEAIPPDE